MTETSFRISRRLQWFFGFFCVFSVLIVTPAVVQALSEGEYGWLGFLAVWVLLFGLQAWWFWFRMPHRVIVTEDALRFLARTREVMVPWVSLREVKSPVYDLNRQAILWKWDGGKLWTAPWDRQHRLLHEVEARAPQTKVTGL